MNDAAAPQSSPADVAHWIEFVGARRDFLRLLMRGAALEFVTLGFYRFWLATDMRRHMWSHTSAGGDTLEYTGTGRELLIGFLIALSVIVPIYLAYFFIGIEAERYQAFASRIWLRSAGGSTKTAAARRKRRASCSDRWPPSARFLR